MKIKTRLILSFVVLSVLPLAVIGCAGLRAMDAMRATAIGESTAALKRLGEEAIHQKAVDVARQIELYLEARPELAAAPMATLQADPILSAVAVQPVGKTGYTAVYDSNGLDYFHSNPKIVGTDLHQLAVALPSFWAILEASLDGRPSYGYYAWQEADGTVRDKYMSCVPVGQTRLRVAATTYIDEFYQPIRATEARITAIFQQTLALMAAALVAVGLGALGLGLWLASEISRPILAISEAAAAVEAERFEPDALEPVARRQDELGQLAHVFQRMAREVHLRAQRLKQQVLQLRIEIDEAKRQTQVREIVETDFFQNLQTRARQMRQRRRRLE